MIFLNLVCMKDSHHISGQWLQGAILNENNENNVESENLEWMSQVEGQNDNAGTILRLTDTLLNPSFQTWLCEDEYITENQKILTRVFHLFSANHCIILEGPSRYKKNAVLKGEISQHWNFSEWQDFFPLYTFENGDTEIIIYRLFLVTVLITEQCSG